MKIFVKYNRDGEILSVSRVNVMPAGMAQPYRIINDDEFVLEAPAKAEFKSLTAKEMHEQYKVDVDKKKLQKIT